MKMKKISRVISVIMVILMLLSISTNVFAAVGVDPSNKWTGNSNAIDDGQVVSFMDSLINIVAVVGSAVAIIALIVLGIKYMMGSAEEKAEYKKTLLPYVIGAVMVFGASMLTGFIYNMVK